MSKLYLRLPPSSLRQDVTTGRGFTCRYALVASGKVDHEGVAALSELSATLAQVERVTLLLAASDVVLLRLKVPPLSPSRLKAALPNLVEDHLIGDSAECAIAAGSASADGVRTVAVVQRIYLESIAAAVAEHAVRRLTIVPGQLCLPWSPGTASVAVEEQASELEITVRSSEHEGFGVAMSATSSARDVLDTIVAITHDASLKLCVPDSKQDDYRAAIDAMPPLAGRTTLVSEDWSCWLDGAERVDLDLVSALGVGSVTRERAWREWRWPVALAAGVLAVNLTGLYADWWRMKTESDRLRAGMVQTFRSAYPNESVILDPLAQMKQKVALSRRASGELAPDDFLVQLSAFADAWTRVAPPRADRTTSPLTAVEFRDRALSVRTRADAEMPEQKLAEALKARGLLLSRATPGTWQIRSAP